MSRFEPLDPAFPVTRQAEINAGPVLKWLIVPGKITATIIAVYEPLRPTV